MRTDTLFCTRRIACCGFMFVCWILGEGALRGIQAQELAPNPQLVEVHRIWDRAAHNAFTDLLHYQGQWYCVFREGSKHVSPDGSLRVITSKDGEHWESLALISHPTDDLRDAKLTIAPDGRFMLNGAGMQADKAVRYHSMVWFSSDHGKTWDEGQRIGDPGFWLWRTQWHLGTAYSMGYDTNRDRTSRTLRLYKSTDGAKFETLVEKVNVPNGVGEDRILFMRDGSALCLLRNESGTKHGLLGRASPPFTDWSWRELQLRIGGPNMMELPDGRILAAVRLYEPKARTSLAWIDPVAGTMTECLALPSGGDTSYAGMVLHEGLLWLSYYSSHEEKTCIYLAKVKL
ncbi:MAG: sialidase family protein [Pirellulaceae bacterium]|nr:sialidase family protein [Pirellulaceae bacterium]